jgi:hypothetical protein
LAESILWNRFLGSLNIYKFGLRVLFLCTLSLAGKGKLEEGSALFHFSNLFDVEQKNSPQTNPKQEKKI